MNTSSMEFGEAMIPTMELVANLQREIERLKIAGPLKSNLTFEVARLTAENIQLKAAFDDRVRVIEMQLADKERLTAENEKLKSDYARIQDSAKLWHDRYVEKCQAYSDRQASLGHEIVSLEAENKALKADAERWQAYQARKQAVINAGLGRNPLREAEKPDTYAVVNKEGQIEYSAPWPEACHDHIKDMQIDHGVGGTWVVRGIKILPAIKGEKS